MTYKLKQQGFTIVELLIVIVVIGILAALVITTFTGIQQKARDTERTTDIKAMHGQVEAYYASKGYYPPLGSATVDGMNNTAWRAANMKGLDVEALKDPKGNGTLNQTSSAVGNYAYNVTPVGCDNTSGNECTAYTLTAYLEAGGTFAKSNLN